MHPPFSRTTFALLAEQAARAPSHPAILTAEGSVTYGELLARAARIAGALRADGIQRGDRVGLLCDNRVEWLDVFFGASALGAVVIPLSTWSKPAELDFLLADSGVRTLFTIARLGDQRFADDIAQLQASGRHAELTRVVVIDEMPAEAPAGWRPLAHYAAHAPLGTLPPGEVASAGDTLVVLYTSGSSNRPKAVPLVHYAAIENGFNIGERQGLGPHDRVLVAIPLFWSYGAVNALPATFTHGATIVLQSRFEPAGALALIERHRATAIYTLPAMTSALLAHASFAPARTASLRTGVTIGAPQDVLRAATELGARQMCNIYGSTESYGNCCVTPHEWSLERRSQCQGPPLPGVRLRIRDGETGALLPVDQVGQLEVAGYLTPGYAGDSARHNGEVFTSDGWFRTGDLAALGADGTLGYAGRSSEMIKRSGINVSPAEVEEVLQQHPDVGLAGVTGLADPVRGEIIVAYLVPRAGAVIDAAAVIAHCRTRLSTYKLPDQLRITASLPLTPTGKLMRRELKAMAAATTEGDAP